MNRISSLMLSMVTIACLAPAVWGSTFYPGISSNSVPWPGGVVPYAFGANLTLAQRATYLDGLREWELAAAIQFVPHTVETNYLLLEFDANAPINSISGVNPVVMTLNRLDRRQICHEMGHGLGLDHENIRTDRDAYITVLTNNIHPAETQYFTIQTNNVIFGSYDFESVMHLGRNFGSIDPAQLDTMVPNPPNERFAPRLGNIALSAGDRAATAHLYGPAQLTNEVTTASDGGAGSLRAALYYAADHPGTTIRFNIPTNDPGFSNGVFTIQLTGYLPLLTDGTSIDGTTQPGFQGRPMIVLDGSQVIPEALAVSGLLVYAANCSIRSLAFNRFNFCGLDVQLPEATNNVIHGCCFGIDPATDLPAPNAFQGILLSQGAGQNIIGGTNALQRNVVSGNTQYGIFITDSNTAGNVVQGNFIGPDASGTSAVPNQLGGLLVGNGAHDNLIGGPAPGAGNVISGNENAGVWIIGAGVTGNRVEGNLIGTDFTGTQALGNTFAGLYLLDGVRSNRIGGTVAGARNCIAGNGSEGLRIADAGTSDNVVVGNWIGLGSGGAPVPNGFLGAAIYSGAISNRIGGSAVADRNIISGNAVEGMRIAGAGTSENAVQGNYVGCDATGTLAVPNGFVGLAIYDGASNNLVGGAGAGAGNVLSGNGVHGLIIADPATTANRVHGNRIGTAADGSAALPNGFRGITIANGASLNIIGLDLTDAGAGNVIAHNFADGLGILDPATAGNVVRGNVISNNGSLGIQIAGGIEDGFGVTANDAADGDSGPNGLQNFPSITTALVSGGATMIGGWLNSGANRSYRVDVYRSSAPDPSGYGEGEIHVGGVVLNTDSGGGGAFALANGADWSGQHFTATASDLLTGDTSEFGPAVTAAYGPSPIAFTGPFAWDANNGMAFGLLLRTNLGYRIQAATNIAGPWVDLAGFTATNPAMPFVDLAATNLLRRFYRGVLP